MKRAKHQLGITLMLWTWANAQPLANEGLQEAHRAIVLSRGVELNTIVSKRTGTSPDIAVLLFPGYPGVLKIRSSGGQIVYDLERNFLVRARRHLAGERVFTVMVDCPVDQWNFCGDHYRTSLQHALDIEELINDLKRNIGATQVYLVGTSYGTLSSSFLAKHLGNKIDGAVHTATFTDPKPGANAHGVPMGRFDWSEVQVPQLFVHHRDDPCNVTRYASVMERKKDIPLITIEGAESPRGNPCQAQSAHGFIGREKLTMQAISDWIINRTFTPTVGQP